MATYVDSDRRDGSTLVGVIGGVCAALGVILLFAAVATLAAAVAGWETDMSVSGWRQIGWAVVAGAAVTALAGFLLGGYVAGRVDRRPGAGNGLLVFVFGALLFGAAAIVVSQLVDIDLRAEAADAGYPTLTNPWTTMGTVALIAIGGAMLVGSLLGGLLGSRDERVLIEEDVYATGVRPRYVGRGDDRVVDVRDEADVSDEDTTERIRRVERREHAERPGVTTHADGSITTEDEDEHARH
jgi:hypothetical protein